MATTGIIRQLDDLGRIVIPKEIRRTMGVREGDALELAIDNGNLVLIPYHSTTSGKVRKIAETLNTMGHSPEEWEIAEQLKEIAKKLEKIEGAN